jgi:hypothetical protein
MMPRLQNLKRASIVTSSVKETTVISETEQLDEKTAHTLT